MPTTTTPIGVTRRGRIVWGNEAGERDFSPIVQRRLRIASAVLLHVAAITIPTIALLEVL